MTYQKDKQLFLDMMGLLNDTTYYCEQLIANGVAADALSGDDLRRMTDRAKSARELHDKAREFIGKQAVESEQAMNQARRST